MTKEELAALLNGREYGAEITTEEEKIAKNSGLVVAFGESDDLLELRGAIDYEINAYEGVKLVFTEDGKFPSEDEIGTLEKYGFSVFTHKIEAEWCPEDRPELSWRITTSLPSAPFTIMEDGEPFCEGVVFEMPRKA